MYTVSFDRIPYTIWRFLLFTLCRIAVLLKRLSESRWQINLRSRGLDASQPDQILITQLIGSNQNKNKKTISKNSSKISVSKIWQVSTVKPSSIFKRPRKVKKQIYHCFLHDCQYEIISIKYICFEMSKFGADRIFSENIF